MPTYDYVCQACEHRFEHFQSMTARPLRKCPECGKPRLKRLIGAGGGLIFKGSGFYITDYRSKEYQSAAEAESGSASKKEGSKSETSSDSKGSSDSTATSSSKSTSEPKSKSGQTKKAAAKKKD